MTEQFIDLSAAIDKLAEKLGIAGENILPFYERRVKINGWARIGFYILFIFAALAIFLIPEFPIPKDRFDRGIVIGINAFMYWVKWIAYLIIVGSCTEGIRNFIEDVTIPRAIAINKLIRDLRAN